MLYLSAIMIVGWRVHRGLIRKSQIIEADDNMPAIKVN